MFSPNRPMPPMNSGGFPSVRPYGYPPQGVNPQGSGGFLSRLMSRFSSSPGQMNSGNVMQGGGMNPANFMQRGVNPANFMSAGGANSAGNLMQGLTNPSTLQNLVNPANLTSMLGNVQKALNTAEQIMPMVQQYGPLVKNIPAMIKMYKELSSDDEAVDEDVKVEVDEITEDDNIEPVTTKKTKKTVKARTSEETNTRPGESKPKLYI